MPSKSALVFVAALAASVMALPMQNTNDLAERDYDAELDARMFDLDLEEYEARELPSPVLAVSGAPSTDPTPATPGPDSPGPNSPAPNSAAPHRHHRHRHHHHRHHSGRRYGRHHHHHHRHGKKSAPGPEDPNASKSVDSATSGAPVTPAAAAPPALSARGLSDGTPNELASGGPAAPAPAGEPQPEHKPKHKKLNRKQRRLRRKLRKELRRKQRAQRRLHKHQLKEQHLKEEAGLGSGTPPSDPPAAAPPASN